VDRGTEARLAKFVNGCDCKKAALALDLDGTTLIEDRGKIIISSSVEKGVKAFHDLGWPVLVNTLRFPLSVMTTVGDAWYNIANVPILTCLLNGSVLGYIKPSESSLIYEELEAFPMAATELDLMFKGIEELLANGIDEILLFYYTRDWKSGETLWTPKADRVESLKRKFVSASQVISTPIQELRSQLKSLPVCMASIFVDRPEDKLMAYQHSKRNSFFTAKGVDKAFGLRKLAERFGLSLKDSIGAGDTEMDSFLGETGLALIVGAGHVPYTGRADTVRLGNPNELGDVLNALANLIRNKPAA